MSYSARNKPPQHRIDLPRVILHRAQMITYLLTCGYNADRLKIIPATDMIAICRLEAEVAGKTTPKD